MLRAIDSIHIPVSVNTRGCITVKKKTMCPVTWATIIFCMVRQHIFYIKYCSSPLTYKIVFQVMCTNNKAPWNSEVQRPLQNCGPSVRNLLHVTLLVPRIWRSSPYYWSICAPALILFNLHRSCLPNDSDVNFPISKSQIKILDGIGVNLKQVPNSGPTDTRYHDKKFDCLGFVHPCLRHRIYLVSDKIPEVRILQSPNTQS